MKFPFHGVGSTQSQGDWHHWSTPIPLSTTNGTPMLAVQPESMWLTPAPLHPSVGRAQRIMVLKGGRPGLHLWSSVNGSDNGLSWSHDSNIGAIHNALVAEESLKFSTAFVNSSVQALESHASGMVRLNASALGLIYDRSAWSRPPRGGEKDAVLFLPVQALHCDAV